MSIRSQFGSSRVGFKMWLLQPFKALFLIHILMVESEPVESSDFLADAQSLHLKDWDADSLQEAVGALKSSASAAPVEKQPQASASAVAADPVNLVSQLLGRLQAAEPVGSIDAYCSQASRCIMGLVSPSTMESPAVSAVNVPSPQECMASHTNGRRRRGQANWGTGRGSQTRRWQVRSPRDRWRPVVRMVERPG